MTPEELAERIHPSMSVERRHAESDLESVRRRTAGIVRAATEPMQQRIDSLRAEKEQLWKAKRSDEDQLITILDLLSEEVGDQDGYRSVAEIVDTRYTELQDDFGDLKDAITRGGFDLSPCIECGKAVVCVPDGLACCGDCAAQLTDAANSEAEENRR